MVQLSERAMLVRFNRGQWGGTKLDGKVTQELTEAKGAVSGSVKAVKYLVPPEALKAVQKATGEARRTHWSRTLPWLDDGYRILTSMAYDDYSRAMRVCHDDCIQAEEEFLRRYEEFRQRGMERQGAMAKPEDYPTADELRSMFTYESAIMPLPTGDDFRVDVPSADVVRESINRSTTEALQHGVAVKLAEVAEAVEHMANKLGEYVPGTPGVKATGVFKDTLVTNLTEFSELLPKLNVFNDPKIDELATEINQALCAHTAKELRESQSIRDVVKDDAIDIMMRMRGML